MTLVMESELEFQEAEKITPTEKTWTNPEFLEKLLQTDSPGEVVDINSWYDQENLDYVTRLIESELDPKVIGTELKHRTQHHTKYFDGDDHYNQIRKSLISIYDALAGVMGKPGFEELISPGVGGENIGFAKELMDRNFSEEVVGREVSKRAHKQFEYTKKLACEDVQAGVVEAYNQISSTLGIPGQVRENLCSVCYSCPLPFLWRG